MFLLRCSRWIARRLSAAPAAAPARPRRRPPQLEWLESRLAPFTGGLDPSFAGTGMTTLGFGPVNIFDDVARAVAVQADGKLVVVGNTTDAAHAGRFAIARYNRDGTLDASFGSGGKETIAFSLAESDAYARAVAIDAQGRIVVAGNVETQRDDFDFGVCRLLSNGTLDTSFGHSGVQTIGFDRGRSNSDGAAGVALEPDGKIVLAGWSDSSSSSHFDFAFVRLNDDGSLDSSFNFGGKRLVSFDLSGGVNGNNDFANAVAVQPDGKIVAAGQVEVPSQDPVATPNAFGVCRLNVDGSFDTSFGSGGAAVVSFARGGTNDDVCNALALQPDGKIVLAGYSDSSGPSRYDFAFARLSANGSLDTSFGQGGKTTVAFDHGGGNIDVANAVTLQPDGKIVAAGYAESPAGDRDFAVCRLNADGALDTSFSHTGKRTVAFDLGGSNDDEAKGVAVSSDGIVLVGYADAGASGGLDFAVARLVRDQWVVVSADQGGPPTVKVFTPTGSLLFQLAAFRASFTGGVRVAAADVNGDGVPDLFCAPGPGGPPVVKIFDGRTLALIRQVQVFSSAFTGGVNLAVGNVLGNGVQLVVAPDRGGPPVVKVFDPLTGSLLQRIQAYGPSFTRGLRVALGDTAGDSHQEILVAPEAGGPPVVKVFDGATGGLLSQVWAYGRSFTAGLYIAAGRLDTVGKDSLIVGPGAGGPPVFKVFDARTGALREQQFVFGPGFTGGVRVGAVDANGDFRDDIIAGMGVGGRPRVLVVDSNGGGVLDSFAAFDPGVTSGLFVTGAAL
jgi:uncharacterized delta-60 repeat protein